MSARKQVIEKAVDDWNAQDIDAYLSMYSPEATLIGYGPTPIGKGEATQFYTELMNAFPGSQVTLHEVLESGDKLVVHYTQSGVHNAEFEGIPATGNHMDMVGIVIDTHDENGQVIERFSLADMHTVYQQLGASPPDAD